MLLSLGTVSSEGVGESACGRGGVDTRRVVDGLWNIRVNSGLRGLGALGAPKWGISRTRDGALANEANEGSAGSAAEDGSDTHCDIVK